MLTSWVNGFRNRTARFQTTPLPLPEQALLGAYIRTATESKTLGLVVALDGGPVWHLVDGKPQPVPFLPALAGKTVLRLMAEPDGTVWAATADDRVIRYDGHTSRTFDVPSRLVGARRISLATDASGRVWAANGADLFLYANERLERQPLALADAEIFLISGRHQSPWLVTNDAVMRLEAGAWRRWATVPALLGAHYVQAGIEDSRGAVWLGTRSRGLHRVLPSGPAAMTGLHDDIYALAEDREGNIWVGTNGAGLHRLRPQTHRLYDKRAGLLLDYSTTLCEDRDGAMWFANRDGGVVRLRDDRFDFFPDLPGWSSYSATAVFPRPEGGIGFSAGPGLYRVGAPGETGIAPLAGVPAIPLVRDAFVTRQGDTWLSVGPDRIGRLRGERFESFGLAEGFPAEEVRAIAEGPDGSIFVATLPGSLLRFNGSQFERVALAGDSPRAAIQAILVEPDGSLWLGTSGAGLLRIEQGRVTRLGVDRGLPHPDVAQILADDHGHLWFGSRGGIFRARRSELLDCVQGRAERVHAIVIGADEGLTGLSCLGLYQPAAWKSRDGQLWFATRRGVLAIDPAAQLQKPVPPPLEITGIRIDGAAAEATARIPGGMRKLEFDFSVLALSTPERVHAKYRLVGFEEDWVAAGPARVAIYPRLPAGNYTFQVVASMGDGAGNESLASLVFSITPRWWETFWFRLLAALIVVGSVSFAVRAWSHRRLRRRLENLERETAVQAERARIAQNIHDDVGASLTRISLLTQAAQHTPAQAPHLEQIYSTVSEITRSMDEIVWAVNPKYDDLESLGYYFGNYAQSFLQAAGLRTRLDIPEHLPKATLTSQTRHHLFLCCKEALNNVVKHAAATAVTVRVSLDGGELVVEICDDGAGLAQHRTAEGGSHRLVSGQGLLNLEERMKSVGGSFTISPRPGGGTCVTFRVPAAVNSAP